MRGILRFPPVLMVIGLGMVAVPVMVADAAFGALDFLLRMALQTAAGLAGYLAFVRWVERRSVDELGLHGALAEGLVGLALGAVLFCATLGTIWLAGGVTFEGVNPGPDLRYAAGLALSAGVIEELAIRGVMFRLLERWMGSWAALAVSAVVFGALHLVNPGATWPAAVAVALEAGVMLAAAFMVTRRLWLPIGLHIGWNFTQAGVFGVAVSGNDLGGWLQTAPSGPDWLSGGDFGAEASVLAVAWCLALGGVLLALAARRGQILDMRGQTWRTT